MSTPNQRRRVVAWEARHDNGWTLAVVEQTPGSFTATAVRDGGAERLTLTAGPLRQTCTTALHLLRTATGHPECSPQCSEWALRLESEQLTAGTGST